MSYAYIVFLFLISFVFSRITHFIREKTNVTYRMKTNCIDGNVHPMNKTINEVKSHHSHLDMSGISHFWSRSRREKVLGLGPGPFRNKFWWRSRSKKTFWSRSYSEKILLLVLVKKNFLSRSRSKKKNLVPAGSGPLCPSLLTPDKRT